MFGTRIGKIFQVNYDSNTVDVLMDSGLGILRGVPVAFPMASTNSCLSELPVLKTVANAKGNAVSLNDGTTESILHLYHLENQTIERKDLEDSTSNYVYGVIVNADEVYGKSYPVCIGFLVPHRNQIIFDPENVDPKLPAVVKKAVQQLKGALIHRTNSDVYWTVDLNANTEWVHPNGSFLRIAEWPTLEDDQTIHIDLKNANKRAKQDGKATTLGWDTSFKKGVDGVKNSTRKLYLHLEINTMQGTVLVDINKKTGNVTIQTPKDTTAAKQGVNKLTIIAGGDAILESVQGNVTVQSVNKEIKIEAKTKVTVITDTNADSSIILAPGSAPDYLPLFTKLAQKFNQHKHTCHGTGSQTSTPDKTLNKNDDATSVTKAG